MVFWALAGRMAASAGIFGYILFVEIALRMREVCGGVRVDRKAEFALYTPAGVQVHVGIHGA